MKGIRAYQIAFGSDGQPPQIVNQEGFLYLWYPKDGVLVNLEAVSVKFETVAAFDEQMKAKGVQLKWLP